jgi:hypothetical protein
VALGKYGTHGIQCVCGAVEQLATLGKHRYDRQPQQYLPKGWSRWGWKYFLCDKCSENKDLLEELHHSYVSLSIKSNSGSWCVDLVEGGVNLCKEETVVLRVEPREPVVYLLGEPFDGGVEEALASSLAKSWLAENGG